MELVIGNKTLLQKIRSFIQGLLLKNTNLLQALLKGSTKIKTFILLLLFLLYCYKKSSMTRIFKVYKKNPSNQAIYNYLKPTIDAFKPTFYLPFAVTQIIKGHMKRPALIVKYESQIYTLPDGEELTLQWFPMNYSSMPAETPIVAFILGACGSSNETYCKVFSDYVKRFGWRIVIINRRGYANQKLKLSRFMHKEEFEEDIHHALVKINEIYNQASLYLIGVSAGANNSAKYLGIVGRNTPVTAYCSISNPFNIGRISYSMKYDFWGNVFSKVIANNFKKVVENHLMAPQFKEFIDKHFGGVPSLLGELKNLSTCWEVDKLLSSKFCG